jgi:hypothetical protein
MSSIQVGLDEKFDCSTHQSEFSESRNLILAPTTEIMTH